MATLTPGGASPDVLYVATQQEPPGTPFPLVIPVGSPVTVKDDIWLLLTRSGGGLVGSIAQGCPGTPPSPLSHPACGPNVELRNWNPRLSPFWKMKSVP